MQGCLSLKSSGKVNYNKSVGVQVMVLGRKIAIKLPKNDVDTHFLLGLRYSRWDSKQFCWIVPNYPGNLDLIRDYFKGRINELVINEKTKNITGNVTERIINKDDLLIVKTSTGRLKLFFGYNKELSNVIKKFHTAIGTGNINVGVFPLPINS